MDKWMDKRNRWMDRQMDRKRMNNIILLMVGTYLMDITTNEWMNEYYIILYFPYKELDII